MGTTASSTLSRHIAADHEAFPLRSPADAFGALARFGGLRLRERVRPYQAVLMMAQTTPDIFGRLTDEQRDSVRVMLLSRLLLDSRDAADPTRQRISGAVLDVCWAELPDEVGELFDAHTHRAVARLAELATPERRVQLPAQGPAKLAAALVHDGETARWLLNGALDDQSS